MDFVTYDNVTHKVDKNKSWVSPKYKQIFTKEVRWDKYAEIKNRYDVNEGRYRFYLVLEPEKDSDNSKVRVDDLGRTRISIGHVWDSLGYTNKTKDFQIRLEYTESIQGCDFYEIITD